jgi:type IV pilus assembly protein PilY1
LARLELRSLFDDSDIFGNNIAPNVMILFDSSGSMSNTIYSHPYLPLSTYNTPLTYSTTKVYRKYTTRSACNPLPRPCYKVYKDTVAEVPNAIARDALHKDPPVATTIGYWTGTISGSSVDLFYGNYLNYLACSSCLIQEQKIVIAKRVVNNIINNTQGVRFGVMKFANNSSPGTGGGGMVATLGTDNATMTAAVNNITPSGYTPLGEQLDDAGRYYKGQPLRNGNTYTTDPISCQPNFVVLITDGLQNGSVDVRTEATNRFSNLSRTTTQYVSGTQNVIVHTVGFAITDADERRPMTLQRQPTTEAGVSSLRDSAQLETVYKMPSVR